MKIVPQTALYILNEDYSKVLLLKRWEHKSLAWLHTWIWWHIESNELENIEEALLRELEEETHITRNDIKDLTYKATIVHSVLDKWDWVMYAYTAIAVEPHTRNLTTDDGELIRYDVSDVHNLLKTWLTESVYDKIFIKTDKKVIWWYRHHNTQEKAFVFSS